MKNSVTLAHIMKEFFCLIFLWLLLTLSADMLLAQGQFRIDSLKQVLENSREDTNKVNTLNALSAQLLKSGDYDESRKYADEALVLSRSLHIGNRQGWVKGEADAYNNIGVVCLRQDNYPEGLQNLRTSINKSEEIGYKASIAYSYNYIGNIYAKQGNYDEALKNYFAALEIAEEIGDKLGIARSYLNIGVENKNKGNYSEALKNYMLALKIRQEIGDKYGIAVAHGSIGTVYWYQGNYPEALKNQLINLQICEELGNKSGVAASHENIGVIYASQENFADALNYFIIAKKLHEELGEKYGMTYSYNNIGSCYHRLGNYDEALKNYLAALKINKEVESRHGLATSYVNIGVVYISQSKYSEALKNYFEALRIQEEIGDRYGMAISYMKIGVVHNKQKRFNEASLYLNKALSLAKEMDVGNVVKDTYYALAEASSGMNNYKKAYEYHQLFSNAKDTMLNDESNKQIAQLKEKYESEKKDAQIALLNTTNELQLQKTKKQTVIRNAVIGGLALTLLIGLLFIRHLRLRQNLKLEKIRFKIAGDLHDDVGSALSSITIFSELVNEEIKDIPPKADALLKKIKDNAVNTQDSMSDIIWAINPKNDRFENILVRMRSFATDILEAKNIDLTFEATENLSSRKMSLEHRKNIFLIFKEGINNVAKYSQAKHCTVRINADGKALKMEIKDDGVGFDINVTFTGNGLKNMRKRSDEIGAQLEIASKKGEGTSIQLLQLAG